MVSSNRYLYLKLNNYDYTPENMAKVFDYLNNHQIPQDIITNADENKFKKRWDKFIIRDNKLIYKDLNLEVIPDENKENKLKELYDDPKIGIGMSQTSFYQKVQQFYLNIKRDEVGAFIKKQGAYQLTTRTQPIVINKPFIAEYPNHRWATDLIDVNYWGKYNKIGRTEQKYILTVIDYFSRYVFAVPLPNKEALTIVNAFKKIHTHQSHCYCKILQSDNGKEFDNTLFKAFCKSKHMALVFNKTYSPTGNALVENFNKYLRKLINEGFIRNNNLNWVKSLNDYLYNRNHTKHSGIKMLPAEVWIDTKKKPDKRRHIIPPDVIDILNGDDKLNRKEIQNKVLKTAQDSVKRKLERYKNDKLNINDRVRIYLPAVDTKLRKQIKAGEKKKIVNLWSPTVFSITRIINDNKQLLKPKYFIDSPHYTNSFFFNELQKVDSDSKDIDIIPSKLNIGV